MPDHDASTEVSARSAPRAAASTGTACSHIIVVEDQRWREPQRVGRAGVDDDPGVEGRRGNGLRRTWLDVCGDQQPAASYAADAVERRRARSRGGRRSRCACSSSPSDSITSSTVSATAAASGLPPNVVPCWPGCSSWPAEPSADAGADRESCPEAFRERDDVGDTAASPTPCWNANHSPVRPMPGLHLVEPQQRAGAVGDRLGRPRGSRPAGRSPLPRPGWARARSRRSLVRRRAAVRRRRRTAPT